MATEHPFASLTAAKIMDRIDSLWSTSHTQTLKDVINTFQSNSFHTQKEASKRYTDIMIILIDYSNALVLCRTEHKLELQEKRLDGSEQSSNLVETSIHLVNGDDFCG
jgi:hypothetical protein